MSHRAAHRQLYHVNLLIYMVQLSVRGAVTDR